MSELPARRACQSNIWCTKGRIWKRLRQIATTHAEGKGVCVQAAVQTIVAQNRLANISKLVASGQAEPRSLVANSDDIRRMTEAAK